MMKSILVIAALMLTSLVACQSESAGNSDGAQPAPTVSRLSAPATTENGLIAESPDEIRSCSVKIIWPNKDHTAIPNPCAQQEHVRFLAMHEHRWQAHGFVWRVATLTPDGLRILVSGDASAARSYFADDPLIAVVRSEAQGM